MSCMHPSFVVTELAARIACLGRAAVDGAAASVQAAGAACVACGKQPADTRLGPLRDLDGYFPYAVAPSLEQWQARATQLRHQMRVALGLWPEPARTPLNPWCTTLDQGDYTVEKVYFESMPGFFVTGSLFRRKGSRTVPGVLCRTAIGPTALLRLRTGGDQEADCAGCRAICGQRPQPAAGALCATRTHGLRRVPL